jgi:hypothetical protein
MRYSTARFTAGVQPPYVKSVPTLFTYREGFANFVLRETGRRLYATQADVLSLRTQPCKHFAPCFRVEFVAEAPQVEILFQQLLHTLRKCQTDGRRGVRVMP